MGKFWSWLFVFVVACCFTAGPAFAQTEKKEGKGGHTRKTPEDLFKKWDANSDGKVTKEEMTAGLDGEKKDRAEKLFKAIAKDGESFTLDSLKAHFASHKKKDKGPEKAPEKAPQ
jgi:hypothetical protein